MLDFAALADQPKSVLLIAGATATGKSRFALDIAGKHGGVIINADSMQIYNAIPILTAQPSAEEQATAPHALYGVLAPDDMCSAPRWARLAKAHIREAWQQGALPIVIGGTGLYLRTLLEGMSPIPDISADVRHAVRLQLKQDGPGAVADALRPLDPILYDKLSHNDSQRLCRALEVVLSTGRPLSEWQSEPLLGGLLQQEDVDVERVVLDVDRGTLYERCNLRFDAMITHGALDELELLLEQNLSSALPIMRAVGVPPLSAWLGGHMPQTEAIELAKRDTRRFAKRQNTWLRNQFGKWKWIKV